MAGIKCVIWDLDNTIWEGICLEDESVELRPGIRDVLEEFHGRGIVQSIASKNEEVALKFVERFGLSEYFVYPHVNWEPKEQNIQRIVDKLNIGLDAVAFIDDNPFERESVAAMLPGVRTYDAIEYRGLPELPEMQLGYDTPEARGRGQMYVEEAERKQQEQEHQGRREEFLGSLNMVATPWLATDDDLTRISELVTRTNQFNSTGKRYTDKEIQSFFESPEHRLHVVALEDKYGDYGRCGVALIHEGTDAWTLEILLLSCRVAGRGLGTSFIAHLTERAKASGTPELRAKYVRTDRNRQMGLLYKILGFERSAELSDESTSVFVYDLKEDSAPQPAWIKLREQVPSGREDV